MSLSSLSPVSPDSRAHEVRMLVDLVRLSRLTLLFAEAGADKSDVLRSSVMPMLQANRGAATKEVAVLLDWWEKAPLAVLNAHIDAALARIIGPAAHALGDHVSADSLCTRLATRQRAFDCTFVIILDRFEDYLAAPADRPDIAEFEAQFVEAVNDRSLGANFLLSLDEDAAPLLERLRASIPGLGDSRVRLPKSDAEHVEGGVAQSPSLPDQLVGSRAASDQRSERHKPTVSLSDRVESARAELERQRAMAAAEQGASIVRASQQQARQTTQRNEREAGAANAGEPVGPIGDMAPGQHDDSVPEATAVDERSYYSALRPEAPSRSRSTRAALMLVIAIAVLSSLVLLATYRGRPALDTRNTPAPNVSDQNNQKAMTEAQGNSGTSAASQTETVNAGVQNSGSNPSEPAGASAVAPTTSSSDSAETGTSHAASIEQPELSAPPPAQAPAREDRSTTTAGEPAAPLLYIHVRSETQRADAVRLIEPLARHGIRVSGIKVTPVGPPVSGLRYFRAKDRAEAARINHALDVVGTPAQRLEYVVAAQEQARQRQYELWLPPPR